VDFFSKNISSVLTIEVLQINTLWSGAMSKTLCNAVDGGRVYRLINYFSCCVADKNNIGKFLRRNVPVLTNSLGNYSDLSRAVLWKNYPIIY
jgi:hypothetical protein